MLNPGSITNNNDPLFQHTTIFVLLQLNMYSSLQTSSSAQLDENVNSIANSGKKTSTQPNTTHVQHTQKPLYMHILAPIKHLSKRRVISGKVDQISLCY